MTNDLEEALSRTLAEAAGAAPPRPTDLLEQVESRFRRRRRRATAAVAGLAGITVLAVIAGSVLATGAVVDKDVDRDRPKEVPLPAAAGPAEPIEEVWPDAYHEIPSRLPDGRLLYPGPKLNDHDLLVFTGVKGNEPAELWTIDIDTQEARRFMRLPPLHAQQEFPAKDFTIGSGHLVWWDSYKDGQRSLARIWKASLDTREPVLVATVDAGQYGLIPAGVFGEQLVVDGDMIYFNEAWAGGIWRVPLGGGEAEQVAGTEGYYHIVAWPWIGKPRYPASCGEQDGKICLTGNRKAANRMFLEIRNAKTGETASATVADERLHSVTCGVSYCAGLKPDAGSEGSTAVVWTRDGAKTRELSQEVHNVSGPAALDRFVLTRHLDGTRLYDLKTGKSGHANGVARIENGLLNHHVGDESIVLLDLTAIT